MSEIVASRRWHKLNNAVCEIVRMTEKIEALVCHCATHKHSILKKQIPELSDARERLYDDMVKQCEDWISEIDKGGQHDNSQALH